MKNSDRQNRIAQQFIQNTPILIEPPLGGKINTMSIILKGTIVLSGGTTNGTVLGEGGPIGLIKRIKVHAYPAAGSRYPGGKIVDCTPRSLLRYAMVQRSGKFIGEQSGSTLGGGANGTYDIYLAIPIYFADANLRRQVETALNADPSAYQTIQVSVETGDVANCFTGNDAAVDYSGLQIQYVDDRENFAGDTYVRYQEDHIRLIDASQERALDNAMPRSGNFESWLIMGEESTAQTLSDALFGKLDVEGSTLVYSKYAQDMRQQMIDEEYFDPSQTLTGLYYVDFTDGLVQGTINAAPLLIQMKITNVSGANLDQLRIMTRRLFQPVKFAPAWGAGTGKNG